MKVVMVVTEVSEVQQQSSSPAKNPKDFFGSEDFLLLFAFTVLMLFFLRNNFVYWLKLFFFGNQSQEANRDTSDEVIIHFGNRPTIGRKIDSEPIVYVKKPDKSFQVTADYAARAYKKNFIQRPLDLKKRDDDEV